MKPLFKLSVLLLALLLPASALAHDFEVDGIYYIPYKGLHYEDYAKVTFRGSSYDEYSDEYTGNVVIPETVTYDGTTYQVTLIDTWAFYGCTGLTEVTIGSNVTSINPFAFYGCTGLTNLTIPNTVKMIERYAFEYCSGLTSLTLGNSVMTIGTSAFQGCTGLTSVTIPSSVTRIDYYAFEACDNLVNITVESDNPKYDSRDQCNAIIETATNTLIAGCNESTIPNSVTAIGIGAFTDCRGLTSVTIPDLVTSIGNGAFEGCVSLTRINIPSSVTSIGGWAFFFCDSLTRVDITDLAAWCNIQFGSAEANPLSQLQARLFLNDVELVDVVVPNTVTQIKDYTFHSCSWLTDITLPNSITSIGKWAFYSCNMASVAIPNSVTIIDEAAFTCCRQLTDMTIPNSVTSLGVKAFRLCNNLTSVTIGNSVTTIGAQAFEHCNMLTSVTCLAETPPTIQAATTFPTAVTSQATLYVPAASLTAYQNANYWKDFNSIQPIVPATSVELNETSIELFQGESVQLQATVLPEDATVKAVNWTSSDESVVTVTADGLVTVVGVGNAVITATTIDGSDLSATCAVTVNRQGGDMNGDGSLDVTDVTSMISAVLNGEYMPYADLNGDGKVDVVDITTLINLILGQD